MYRGSVHNLPLRFSLIVPVFSSHQTVVVTVVVCSGSRIPGPPQPRVAASRPEEAERQSERDGFESALRRFPRTHIAASSQTS